ncbi:MAG: YceI family protein [Candidatus Zixiibacteriota bacterium]|nr:MAG: YceI family protein [candidate division Zixibacteria bacterium]
MIIISLGGLVSLADAAEWKIDKSHSSVNFEVRHLVITKTHGNFTEFDGTLNFDESSFEESAVTFSVKTASVNTDDEARDEHLRSADFLDAEKYPDMTFKSVNVTRGEGAEFKLVGDLTIRGVTKSVTFECEYFGTVKDPWGNSKSGFTAKTRINRHDFGVSWSKTLDSGGLVVGDEVTIILDLEFGPAG